MDKSVLQSIEEHMESFTKAQRKVADYILKNPTEVAFLTIEQLSGLTKVSVTTVMRLTYALSYSGYTQFQKDLQELLRNRIAPSRRLAKNLEKVGQNKLLSECVEMQINNINKTAEFLNDEIINKALELIEGTKKICVIGVRGSYPAANYLSNGLIRLGLPCEQLIPESVSAQNSVTNLTSDDLVIAISLPRYAKHTLDVCKAAKSRGAKILAITDGYSSPLSMLADVFFPCAYDSLSFQNSHIGIMFLAEFLITGMGIRLAQEAKTRLEEVEKIMPTLDANVVE